MTHTPFILFVLTCPNSWYLSKRSEKTPSRHSSQDVFIEGKLMTYNNDPSTSPDLFTTHSDPCKKKPVWYQLFPLNDCPFRVNKCRDPSCVAFFWGKARGWYHCRTTWGQCSFYRTARWTSTCRHCNLQGSSRYQKVLIHFRKNKTARTTKKKHMGQEFPALQQL